MRLSIRFVSSPADPEKLVLPGVVWLSASHPKYESFQLRGGAVLIGWWHWALAVFFATPVQEER